MPIDPDLLAVLACPSDDHAPLREVDDELICSYCESRYPVRDGIPVLLLGQPVFAVFCLALLKTGLETGRIRMFEAFTANPAFTAETREKLKALGTHALH